MNVLRWAPRFRLRSSILALVAIAALELVVGRSPLLLHGVADEAAHTLTAFIWYTAGVSIGLPVVFVATIVGSAVLDLDHVPLILGWIDPLPGTTRPGTHSLPPVALFLLLAARDPARRGWWASAALGMGSHLWRDLGTGTVAVLWPLSAHPVGLPYHVYLTGTVVLVLTPFLWKLIAHARRAPPRAASVQTRDGEDR